jgi:hypothetical protein
MLRRTIPLLALVLLTLPAGTASAQAVPTLTLGASASVSLIPPGEIQADGKRISLNLLVADESGRLANGVKFRGSGVSSGRLDGECAQAGPGLYSCTYTTPEGTGNGSAELRIKAKLESGTALTASYQLDLVGSTRAGVAFNATPPKLVLGQDAASSMTFTLTDARGTPVPGLSLKAQSNAGTVSAVVDAGGGNYTATFTPPTTPFPQVAVVSVWALEDPEGINGFFRIPLVGAVRYPVETRRPNASIEFTVGDTTFPAVTADANGRAEVPIEVPPGIGSAKVKLTETSGATSDLQIDLQVPPANRLAMGGLPEFLPADGESEAKISLFAVDAKGRPADGQTINLLASQGKVTNVKFVGDGRYEAMFKAPALDSAARVRLTATIQGEEAVSTQTYELGLEPGVPGEVRLTAAPEQLTPNDKKVALTAHLLDDKGQPFQGSQSVVFRTAEGPINNTKVGGQGVFTAELPVVWNVRTRVQALASIRGNRQPVTQLVALPLDDQVLTGQKMPISVLSLDRYGNPVADVAVNVTVRSGGGQVTASVQTNAQGIGTVLFTAGQLAGLALVDFVAGEASYTAPLWQGTDYTKGFEFKVSGGQRQGRILSKWNKLRGVLSLGSEKKEEPVVLAPTDSGSPWGTSGGTETAPVGVDSGSVSKAGVASDIQLSVLPSSVPVTGGTVNVLVRVVDSSGILVPGENVIILSNAGTVSNKVDNGDGTFSAILTVPPDTGLPSVQVTATRPAGDVASFVNVAIGGEAVAEVVDLKKKEPRKKEPKAATTTDDARLKRRFARAGLSWLVGGYTYDATPCVPGQPGCTSPTDPELANYDFLKADGDAPLVANFAIGGEIYPLKDLGDLFSLGAAVNYTLLSYRTDFPLVTDQPEADYCTQNFCDQMSFLAAEAKLRFSLIRAHGPLDLTVGLGYAYQDVVVFRRIYHPATGTSAAYTAEEFEGIEINAFRLGFGAEYTVIPQVRPHVNYGVDLGIHMVTTDAATGDKSFIDMAPGVVSHHLNLGVGIFPIGPLMIDAAYEMAARSLSLNAGAQDCATAGDQCGQIDEAAHTFKITAGVAF